MLLTRVFRHLVGSYWVALGRANDVSVIFEGSKLGCEVTAYLDAKRTESYREALDAFMDTQLTMLKVTRNARLLSCTLSH